MPATAVHVRFVGMLSSLRAEALARDCISGIEAACGAVARWDVYLQPPLAPRSSSGYAVRAQAQLSDGSLLAIRAQGEELEDTVRDAFGGMRELLLQSASGCPQAARQ